MHSPARSLAHSGLACGYCQASRPGTQFAKNLAWFPRSAADGAAMTVPAKSVPGKLRVDGVSMMFETPSGAFTALADVTLVVPAGRFVSLIGPSGCGKS